MNDILWITDSGRDGRAITRTGMKIKRQGVSAVICAKRNKRGADLAFVRFNQPLLKRRKNTHFNGKRSFHPITNIHDLDSLVQIHFVPCSCNKHFGISIPNR